jgi:hypothetical protein
MSKITIDFRTTRDFDVTIDNIDALSPRGMDMAWLQVEKAYLAMKGANVHSIRVAKKAAEDQRVAEEAKALRIQQLAEEELAQHREQALAAASERYEALNADEKRRVLEAQKAGDTSSALKNLLAAAVEHSMKEKSAHKAKK